MASFGIVLLALLRTPLRHAGAVALAIATLWAAGTRQPDILIAGDGQTVAVRGRDGRLHVMRTSKDTFLVKEWLGADADARQPIDESLGEGVSCDPSGCVTALGDGALVALTLQPDAFVEDCERTVIIVTAKQAPIDCRALLINRETLQGQGATTLRRTKRWDCCRSVASPRPRSPMGTRPRRSFGRNSVFRPFAIPAGRRHAGGDGSPAGRSVSAFNSGDRGR